MYSSYSLSKRLVSVHILAIQLLLVRSVSSLNLTNAYLNYKCRVSEGKYRPGSEYEENLNFLIKKVSANDMSDGFTHIGYGEAPNYVAIIFGCRGDSYGPKCRSCYATAVAGLRKRCERNKGGIIWYDQCFLDLSTINRRPPRKIDHENTFSMHNPNNVTGDIKSFNKNLEDFLDELIVQANRLPGRKGAELINYAAGEKRLGTKKLYAMVQCTKDMYPCKNCLEWNLKELSKCCDGKQGARVLSTTCSLSDTELFEAICNVLSQSQDNAFLYHKCSDIEGNFTSRSPYESNLNGLFPVLSYIVPSTGFAAASTGDTPDKVNGLALCRGDASTSDCQSCFATAFPELRKRCPNNKAGIIWYDNCLVKYSSTNFFGKIDYENKFYLYNVNNVSDPASFNTQTKALLTELTKKATAGDNQKLFSTGEKNLGEKKLYGLVQCTRDLKSESCKACLDGIIGEIPNCCGGKEGGRIVGGSCNFRYEIYPFVKSA